MESLRDQAKETYMSLRSKGKSISIADLSRRSEEFFGEFLSAPTLNKWSYQDGWNTEFVDIDLDGDVGRLVDLIADVHDGIEIVEDPTDLSYFCRSFYYLLGNIPEKVLLTYQDSISDVRSRIYKCLHERERFVAPSTQASLIRTYMDLKRYEIAEPDDRAGFDVDAILMGVDIEPETD